MAQPAFLEALTSLAGIRGMFARFVSGRRGPVLGRVLRSRMARAMPSLTLFQREQIATQFERSVQIGRRYNQAGPQTVILADEVPITRGARVGGERVAPFIASVSVTFDVRLPDGSVDTITRQVLVTGDRVLQPNIVRFQAQSSIIAQQESDRYMREVVSVRETKVEWAFRTRA